MLNGAILLLLKKTRCDHCVLSDIKAVISELEIIYVGLAHILSLRIDFNSQKRRLSISGYSDILIALEKIQEVLPRIPDSEGLEDDLLLTCMSCWRITSLYVTPSNAYSDFYK